MNETERKLIEAMQDPEKLAIIIEYLKAEGALDAFPPA